MHLLGTTRASMTAQGYTGLRSGMPDCQSCCAIQTRLRLGKRLKTAFMPAGSFTWEVAPSKRVI